jgi:hypothetical protein
VARVTLIAKGTLCDSKTAFAELLRRWYSDTEEKTLGDLDRYPGVTTWVKVRTSGHDVRVHADTNRDAVRRYLELVSELGPELPWRVERGQRGTLNKVVVDPDGQPTKGLFIYTIEPLPHPMTI